MQNAYPLGAEAQGMQGYGRNGDTMLMHVSPEEVSGLQALAQANGTSLTINPDTGMPEAFSLKKLLPALAGAALTIATGGAINPLTIAAVVGGVKGIASGSLKKGLMAGLQAYGGASLAGAAGAGAVFAPAAAPTAGNALGLTEAGLAQAGGLATPAATIGGAGALTGAVTPIALSGTAPALASAAPSAIGGASALAGSVAPITTSAATNALAANAPTAFAPVAAKTGLQALTSMLPQGVQDFGGRFAAEAGRGMPSFIPSGLAKYAPYVAGTGLMQGAAGAFAPKMPKPTAENNFNYEGPYTSPYREVSYPSSSRDPNDSSEHLYFRNTNPVPGYVPYSKAFPARQTVDMEKRLREEDYGFAKGGMRLEDGAFIVDARTVSELGNGSSGAGQERLKRLGGQSIKGGGDGVSDSIRANIGGRQEARVARDEVKFSPQAVARIGRGNQKRGADKLYALMAKAEKARKSAKRGQDTGLASLLRA